MPSAITLTAIFVLLTLAHSAPIRPAANDAVLPNGPPAMRRSDDDVSMEQRMMKQSAGLASKDVVQLARSVSKARDEALGVLKPVGTRKSGVSFTWRREWKKSVKTDKKPEKDDTKKDDTKKDDTKKDEGVCNCKQFPAGNKCLDFLGPIPNEEKLFKCDVRQCGPSWRCVDSGATKKCSVQHLATTRLNFLYFKDGHGVCNEMSHKTTKVRPLEGSKKDVSKKDGSKKD